MILFNVKLVGLLETGTCASGNTPFEIARQCPEGTGTDILLLGASVVAGLLGIALFAARGRPPWARGRASSAISTGVLAWAVFFTATGAAALITALTSETIGPDGEAGGAIVGATFLLMGLPALAYVLWWPFGQLLERRNPEAAATASGSLGASLPTHAGSADPSSGWISSVRPAGAVPAAPATTGVGQSSDAIARLERLRESGALTETEFQLQKNRILSE